jgi:secondary thiamine-phosphate synthase enzyme
MSRITFTAGPAGPVIRQSQALLRIATRGQGFTDLTAAAAEFVEASGVRDGLLTLLCRHTSASLTIQENADPDVRTDLLAALDRSAPRSAPYRHTIEGPDDMPAHIRTVLTGVDLSIPVRNATLFLGTWQAIYLIEHRDRLHEREVALCVVGGG